MIAIDSARIDTGLGVLLPAEKRWLGDRGSAGVGFWLKARFIGVAAGALVGRTLKDQWFALALGAAALTALFWLELIAY